MLFKSFHSCIVVISFFSTKSAVIKDVAFPQEQSKSLLRTWGCPLQNKSSSLDTQSTPKILIFHGPLLSDLVRILWILTNIFCFTIWIHCLWAILKISFLLSPNRRQRALLISVNITVWADSVPVGAQRWNLHIRGTLYKVVMLRFCLNLFSITKYCHDKSRWFFCPYGHGLALRQ